MTIRWTPEEIRGLGARTDLRTACDVVGIGYTTGKAMARAGTLPFPIFRCGAHKYVVPVAGLLRLLLLVEPAPDMDEATPASAAAVTTDTVTGGPHAQGNAVRGDLHAV